MIIRYVVTRLLSTPSCVWSSCCFSSTASFGSQWQTASGTRNAKASRSGPPRGRDGSHWRNNERRPPLLRTNDGKDIPQLVGEGVYGIHSVLQALESGHRIAYALYVREERTITDGQRCGKKSAADLRSLKRIQELVEAKGIAMHPTSKWMLNHITGDKPHQGVVLDAAQVLLKEFTPAAPSDFPKTKRSPVILVLDEIHDPQNLGAILRSAHFLGCSAVVVSEGNSAPLSPAVSRASVGALEVLLAHDRLMKARNLHEVLAISSDLGWRIVGADSGPNSIPSTTLSANDRPSILVLVKRSCFTVISNLTRSKALFTPGK